METTTITYEARGTRPEELKLLCSLFMSDDHGADSVLQGDDDDIVRDFLDSQARAHGYANWVVAYHEIDR